MRSKASKRALHQLPVTEVNLEDTLGAALLPAKLKGGKILWGKHQGSPEDLYVHQAGLALLKIETRAPRRT